MATKVVYVVINYSKEI